VTPARAAAALLGAEVLDVRPLGGPAHHVRLADGREAVLKSGPNARAEAAGLRWLRAADTVPTPEVLGVSAVSEVTGAQEWLAIEWVPPGSAGPGAAVALGRGLADLHAAGAPAFGAPPPDGPVDAWIGRAPMRNVTGADWAEWYAQQRVLPYLRTAVDQGALSAEQARVVERACARATAPAEPPARVHGDLWSGNVHWAADGRAWLIDPAAHGGHRETDLAMLHLFGCPRLDRVLAGYQEVAPLAAGWAARIGLHQLFPLAVHTVLFGGGYAAQLLTAARSVPG
jgi:fructosamine-3-kinase